MEKIEKDALKILREKVGEKLKDGANARMGFWFLLAIVGGTAIYQSVKNDEWVWRSHVPHRTGALPLYMPHTIRKLELDYVKARVDLELQFAIAEDEAAVRSFWRSPLKNPLPDKNAAQDGSAGSNIIKCTKLEQAPQQQNVCASNQKKKGLDRFVTCERYGDKLTIHLCDFTPPPTEASPKPEIEPPPQDLWLIPYRDSSTIDKYTVQSIDWTGVSAADKPIIKPADCRDKDDSDAKPAQIDSCIAVDRVLGIPLLERARDLKTDIARNAIRWERKFSPTVFGVMAFIDALLVLALVYVSFGSWGIWGGGRFAKKDPSGRYLDAESMHRGFRRYLQWLETTGPAIAFIFTTLGLLNAFHTRASSNDESLFQEQIAVAMTATFLGLTMRVLANSLDTTIGHLAHRHADPDGVVPPESVKGAEANKVAKSLPAATHAPSTKQLETPPAVTT